MIGIVDYGVGNIGSILRAFERLEIPAALVSQEEEINSAERLILPGVGHAAQGMEQLRSRGLIAPLLGAARRGIPILGICLGMQLLTKQSAEGSTTCLGLIDAETVKFLPSGGSQTAEVRIPHMGWNSVEDRVSHPIFSGVADDAEFYFAHSYVVRPAKPEFLLAKTPYLGGFVSVIGSDNVLGVQFHPEKSREGGAQILKNFSLL